MPEQSAAKAKELLQQAIDALGGTAYLERPRRHLQRPPEPVRPFRRADRASKPSSTTQSRPSKTAPRIFPSATSSTLTMAIRAGRSIAAASPKPPSPISPPFRKTSKGHRQHPAPPHPRAGHDFALWRPRRRGPDQEVDWVEFVDSDNRTIRIAIAATRTFRIRKMVDTRDPTRACAPRKSEYYSNYHPIDGVKRPSRSLASATA